MAKTVLLQPVITREEHWHNMHAIKEETGSLPEHAFDFISIHQNQFNNSLGLRDITLMSPMCLVTNESRPDWENIPFPTLSAAIKYAKRIIKRYKGPHKLFIVDCL